jgi:hypothetical protein
VYVYIYIFNYRGFNTHVEQFDTHLKQIIKKNSQSNQVMAVPLLPHGYENWTSREHEGIETVEMKCSQSVAGYTLCDDKAKKKDKKN